MGKIFVPVWEMMTRDTKLDPATGCLEWTGDMSNSGYGRISRNGVPIVWRGFFRTVRFRKRFHMSVTIATTDAVLTQSICFLVRTPRTTAICARRNGIRTAIVTGQRCGRDVESCTRLLDLPKSRSVRSGAICDRTQPSCKSTELSRSRLSTRSRNERPGGT
jgi:hypothetical protein